MKLSHITVTLFVFRYFYVSLKVYIICKHLVSNYFLKKYPVSYFFLKMAKLRC